MYVYSTTKVTRKSYSKEINLRLIKEPRIKEPRLKNSRRKIKEILKSLELC